MDGSLPSRKRGISTHSMCCNRRSPYTGCNGFIGRRQMLDMCGDFQGTWYCSIDCPYHFKKKAPLFISTEHLFGWYYLKNVRNSEYIHKKLLFRDFQYYRFIQQRLLNNVLQDYNVTSRISDLQQCCHYLSNALEHPFSNFFP